MCAIPSKPLQLSGGPYVDRSRPLTTFHFIHGNINEEDFLGLFRSASSTLQEVKLLDVGPLALTDDILTPLEISNPDDVLLQRLHALHISGEVKFDANLLAKMVKSRWACEVLLSSVCERSSCADL